MPSEVSTLDLWWIVSNGIILKRKMERCVLYLMPELCWLQFKVRRFTSFWWWKRWPVSDRSDSEIFVKNFEGRRSPLFGDRPLSPLPHPCKVGTFEERRSRFRNAASTNCPGFCGKRSIHSIRKRCINIVERLNWSL